MKFIHSKKIFIQVKNGPGLLVIIIIIIIVIITMIILSCHRDDGDADSPLPILPRHRQPSHPRGKEGDRDDYHS